MAAVGGAIAAGLAGLPRTARGEIRIPAPYPHQRPAVESAAPRKLVRAGRRGGKTVLAEHCAVVGHGPIQPDGSRLFKGAAHGYLVPWIARDHTQASIVWQEFFVPRFKGKQGVRTNENDKTVTLPNGGRIWLVSAENIASLRGAGATVSGVVVEEAAWLDLAGALQDVINPLLMDNEGWLVLISTTNAGPDGGKDKETGNPRVPSYFNTLAEEIQQGKRSDDWEEFYFTAEDNPRITARAFQALVAEYAPGSLALEQEVYARIVKGGVGVALPELDRNVHLVPRIALADMPDSWRHFGAFDWGFNHPWSFGWYVVDDDANVAKVETVTGTGDLPEAIVAKIRAAGVPLDRLGLVHCGHDIFDKKGRAIGYHGPTIAEKLRQAGLRRLIKANVSRVQGLDNLRRFIHFEVNEAGDYIVPPQFALFDTPNNRLCFACLAAMQTDPDNPEDALKVDANAKGEGGDDRYDETRYALMSRWRSIRVPPAAVISDDMTKPIDYRRRQMMEHPHDADVVLDGQTGRRIPHVRRAPGRRGGGHRNTYGRLG